MARLFDDALSEFLEKNVAPVTAVPLTMATWFRTDDIVSNQLLLMIPDKDSQSQYFELSAYGGDAGDPDNVSSAFTIRVQDCERTYMELKSRGAQFLTPPTASDGGGEVRCFFRDPSGHLFEISQVAGL